MLTRVDVKAPQPLIDVLWLECVNVVPAAKPSRRSGKMLCWLLAPARASPDACSWRDLEAEERGCLRLSDDIGSSQDGLLFIS